jgi:signal transduction histidine kinase
MLRFIIRHRAFITYLAAYFFGVSTFLRYLDGYLHQPYQGAVIGLLSAFLLLSVLEPLLSRRSKIYTHLYLGIQSGIIVAVALMPHHDDWFSNLYIVLTLQAAHVLPSKTAFRWIGAFALTGALLLLYARGLITGLPVILITVVAVFMIGSWLALIRHAETSQRETQTLLSELQEAHRQLQLYTAQAEELAVLEDRNRLARNLHDSVSQTIFSMRLTAEAARLLLEQNKAKAREQLERLQELAESALASMRALIHELRPTAIAEQGLVPALRRLLALLERQHGLSTTFDVSGEPDLSSEQAEQVYRIVQEGLNNVVKHAQIDRATVVVRFDKNRLTLRIEDRGKGFSPEQIKANSESIGLSSMRERVESLGGTLKVDSSPGQGTRINVEVLRANKDGADG